MLVEQFGTWDHRALVVVKYWMRELELVIKVSLARVVFRYAFHVGIFKLMELN
jgi:hypothetical protein